jgi:Rieske Fe-S protein
MEQQEDKGLPRRRFLKVGVGSIGGIMGIGYLGLVGGYFNPPSLGSEPLKPVGEVSDFQPRSPKLVVYNSGGIEQGVYVINFESEGWLALDFHCTHLQCAVNWIQATNTFACPCHGGVYDIKGNVISGPPPHALHHREIKIQGNTVLIGGILA